MFEKLLPEPSAPWSRPRRLVELRRWVEGFYIPASGGRTWWAHFEFTRTNIEPIILRKKIEELCILCAFSAINGLN
jgi:hypothetical protein